MASTPCDAGSLAWVLIHLLSTFHVQSSMLLPLRSLQPLGEHVPEKDLPNSDRAVLTAARRWGEGGSEVEVPG